MKPKRLLTISLLLGLLFQLLPMASSSVLAKSSSLPAIAPLVSVIVNSTADPGNGVCDSSECTLREAIGAVATGGTIEFALPLPAVINLTAGQLLIDKAMTIHGPGRLLLTVNGKYEFETGFRPLRTSGIGITIVGLTISNGMTLEPGAGLYNTGDITLKDVVVVHNRSMLPNSKGGGIYNAPNSILHLENVTIRGNEANSDGGGISNDENAIIYMRDSQILENVAETFSGFAGGIANASGGKIWIQIGPNGEQLPGKSTIISNEAGGGAGFVNNGEMRIANTTIQWNTSYNGSPALINGGFLSVVESQIVGNGTGENYGGALVNYGTLEFVRSLMSGNSAQKGTGGLTNGGNATIANSTISYHDTDRGMGVIDNGGVMTITSSTIYDSFVYQESETGYGIRNQGTLKMANTIVAHSKTNCAGTIISLGNNISSDNSCSFTASGDQNNVDPKLDGLKDNGGPTFTHALLPGSPAIDSGNNSLCPATDQRNQARPKDGNGDGNAVCDIGAYEAPVPPTNKATIMIRKDTQPDSMQDFTYYGPFGKFYLDDIQPDDGDAVKNSVSYTVNPGIYNFAEGVFQSWHLANIVCTGSGQSSNNLPMHSVNITVKAGDQMLCTFVTQRRVDLEAKIYNDLSANRTRDANEPPLRDWEFRFYTSDGSLINHKVTDANGSAKQSNVIPGSFKICETPKAGWTNTQYGLIDPVLGVPCYTVTLAPGQSTQLVFGVTQASVVLNSEEVDSTSGTITGTLTDINEPESEELFEPEVNQRVYLPLVNR